MIKYITSQNQQDIIAAEAQICTNCGLPNGAGTVRRSEIRHDALSVCTP
jgi:hypothetical protein